MAQFATTDDLATYLGVTYSGDEEKADLCLTLATGAIQGWTRQTILLVEGDEVVLKGTWANDLVLPERPVLSVESVAFGESVVDAASYLLKGDTLSRPWGWSGRAVTVTYDHGFADIPEDVRSVCLALAARTFRNPDRIIQEGIGTYNVTYDRAGGWLNENEKQLLSRYRRRTL